MLSPASPLSPKSFTLNYFANLPVGSGCALLIISTQANWYLSKPVQLDAFESLVKHIVKKVELPQQR